MIDQSRMLRSTVLYRYNSIDKLNPSAPTSYRDTLCESSSGTSRAAASTIEGHASNQGSTTSCLAEEGSDNCTTCVIAPWIIRATSHLTIDDHLDSAALLEDIKHRIYSRYISRIALHCIACFVKLLRCKHITRRKRARSGGRVTPCLGWSRGRHRLISARGLVEVSHLCRAARSWPRRLACNESLPYIDYRRARQWLSIAIATPTVSNGLTHMS